MTETENKYDNSYQIRIGSYDGKPTGKGCWGSSHATLYLSNFRTQDDFKLADIQTQTSETRVNKNGEVKPVYRICGVVRWNDTEATAVIELDNEPKEKRQGISRLIKGEGKFEDFRVLDFRSQKPNKYENDL